MPSPSAELGVAEQAAMVQALCRRENAMLVETHLSWVLVGPQYSHKLKKALRTPFADQSTRQRRQRACEEELRLNRRLAPGLYEAVVPVTGSSHAPAWGGDGRVLDHAVRMRSFDASGLWETRATRGTLATTDIDELVASLLPFHRRAAVAIAGSEFGAPAAMRAIVRQNLTELAEAGVDAATLSDLNAWEARAFAAAEPRMHERLARGRVRECHGDLHLGNVTRFEGRTTAFDGIEFAPALRWMDVMGDVAFMAMDLHAHGLPGLAHRFVNACLEAGDDHDGLPVLDYQCVHRALVRAKVALLRAAQRDAGGQAADDAQARRYLATARTLATPRQPRLWFTHGCSGSGKSTFTQQWLETQGALRFRSDVERRRLAAQSGPSRYAAAVSEATYARLRQLSRRALLDGHSVIVDATFLRRTERDALRRLAADLAVPCQLIDFASGADLPLMQRRVLERAIRGGDASEADLEVLQQQLQQIEPLEPEERALALPGWPQPP